MAENLWIDQSLTVNANTVYASPLNGTLELVGKDVEVTLPGVANKTVDAAAMGTFTVPVIGQIDNMEMKIHHIGVDLGLAKMLRQESLNLEIRWIEQVMDASGGQTPTSRKAFITAFPQSVVPEITVTPGESVDVECVYTVIKYKATADGEVLWDIDRLGQKLVVNGKDYFADLSSAL